MKNSDLFGSTYSQINFYIPRCNYLFLFRHLHNTGHALYSRLQTVSHRALPYHVIKILPYDLNTWPKLEYQNCQLSDSIPLARGQR
jgi:hypothetical protein